MEKMARFGGMAPRRLAPWRLAFGVLAFMAAALLAPTLLQPAWAQQSQPAAPSPLAALEPFKFELDQVEAAIGREGISDDALAELRDRIGGVRDNLRGRIDALEPQLSEVDTRQKQLGAPPPP